MKALIKALNWIERISALIGLVFIILGFISAVFGRILPNTESIKYFHIANSFFLFAIVLFLFIHLGQYKKE
jgi:TRAP-type mannitol/chloroaromatic compound transport system permease small subunit